MSICHWR